jgi:hypothetical protein
MSSLKRARLDDCDHVERRPCCAGDNMVLTSTASRDNRRVERWSGICGLMEELRVLLEHGVLTDDETTLVGARSELRRALDDVLRVTSATLSFRGSHGDCFEAMSALDSLACRLLTTYGSYRVSEGGAYLTLEGADCGGLAKVASLRCAAARLIARLGTPLPPTVHVHLAAVHVGLCGVNGFGWYDGLNSVPAVIRASQEQFVDAPAALLLLWDTMLTDAGTPTVAKALRWPHVAAHHRYGVGAAALGLVEGAATLSLDGVVGLAVLFAPCGPLVVHVHCPSHSSPNAEELRLLHLWLTRCCEAPMPALLVVTGMSSATVLIEPPAGFYREDSVEQSAYGIGYLWCRGGSVSWVHTAVLSSDEMASPPARSRSPLQDKGIVEQVAGVSTFSTWMFHCGIP